MNDFQRSDYGPNYRTEADQRKATARITRESWYDAFWFAMLLLLVVAGVIGFDTHYLTWGR